MKTTRSVEEIRATFIKKSSNRGEIISTTQKLEQEIDRLRKRKKG